MFAKMSDEPLILQVDVLMMMEVECSGTETKLKPKSPPHKSVAIPLGPCQVNNKHPIERVSTSLKSIQWQ